MITLENLGLQRGSKILLQDANVRVHDGNKVGLVGANGCGKSTLFKLLTGELGADQGECRIPAQWRVAHMVQEIVHSERRALDYVLDGDVKLRQVQQQIQQLQSRQLQTRSPTAADGEALAHLYAELETIDGYTAESRAQELLHGLGFRVTDSQRPVHDFSGGWRIRLNLARALMCPADLLLLDEPTNHLDLDTTWWLEQRLQQYRGTLLVISHDRDFLDNIVDRIVHFEHCQLKLYSGNYSDFEERRAEQLAQQQQLHQKQQAQVADIERFVARFRAKASKARQAQSRLKALQRLEIIAPAHVDSPFSFHFPCAEKTSQPLLQLSHCDLGYAAAAVLHKIDLRIEAGSRLGLLGPNGAGKSTLVKGLVGELLPISGECTRGEHLAVGYFNQHQLEALDLNASAALHLQRQTPTATEQQIRNYLGSFGFNGDRALETIHHFSGGEKARLALALIAWRKPNLLLLDEPTNHLDLDMREALTIALQEYPGAMVLISHDRHLLRNSVDEFLLVADGQVASFDGDLEDYHRWLQQRDTVAREAIPSGQQESKKSNPDRRQQRQQNAALRQQLQPLRNKVSAAEKRVEKLQRELDRIEQTLLDNDLYESQRKPELQQLVQRQGELRGQLATAEDDWLTLSEEYEALESSCSSD